MLKFGALARQIKFLKPVRQQYMTIRLFNNGTPRVLITGLFTVYSMFVQGLYMSRILMLF
jgi:hypothetical protein